jgi:hypothetical protein
MWLDKSEFKKPTDLVFGTQAGNATPQQRPSAAAG